jgi:glucose/arabinose dehydrogenase
MRPRTRQLVPTALMIVVASACGNGGKAKDDAAVPRDTGPTADAPPLIACTPTAGTNVRVRQIGRVNSGAMLATSPPGDGRLFVVEQNGRIRIFENEELRTEPFLDVSELPNFAAGGEQGLLGLAFHPHYAVNRQFYVFYTTGGCPGATCANVVARYFVSETDLNKADPAGEVILSIPDFASNHNGGMIEFGSDGYLYIGTGDGGGGGDPQRVGQDPNSLLGKILRIDVNSEAGGKKYAIPADNPYATSGGAPEVYILGLRNPWRWSFDRETGDMWIGDVGQNNWEEVTVVRAGQQAGANLGWSKYEGNDCYGNHMPCAPNSANAAGMTGPQIVRRNSGGNPAWRSVIGGEVYRGSCFPDLRGFYFFTDYAARPLVRGRLEADGRVTTTDLPAPQGGWPQTPASLHGDARGELFLTTTQGYVYQIEAGP